MALQTSVFIQQSPGGTATITAGTATGNYGRQVTVSAVADPGWKFERFQVEKQSVTLLEVPIGAYASTANQICTDNLGTEISRWLWTDGRSYYSDAAGTVPAPFGYYGAGRGQYYRLDAGGLVGPTQCFVSQPPATPAPAALSYGYCNCGNGCVDGYAPNRPCPAGCVPCTPRTPTPAPTTPAPTPAPIDYNNECDIVLQNCPSGFTCQIVQTGTSTTFANLPTFASKCVPVTPPPTTPAPIVTPSPIFRVTIPTFTPSPINVAANTPAPTTATGGGGAQEQFCSNDFDCYAGDTSGTFGQFRCIDGICVRTTNNQVTINET